MRRTICIALLLVAANAAPAHAQLDATIAAAQLAEQSAASGGNGGHEEGRWVRRAILYGLAGTGPWMGAVHLAAFLCSSFWGETSCRSCKKTPRPVIPAKAGRSAKCVERPKHGPGGVSEANHPVTCKAERHWIYQPRCCGAPQLSLE